ncbi:MAG: hypothetical protein ACLUOS_19385 [Odoribacter splanchnicus]
MRFISNQLLVKFHRKKVVGGIATIARVTTDDIRQLTSLENVRANAATSIPPQCRIAQNADRRFQFIE